MNQPKPAVASNFDTNHISLKSYCIGFVSCIVLTLVSYFVAVSHDISDRGAIIVIAGLAILQAATQLQRFLHLGQELKPRWKLIAFIFMMVIVAIFVGGSLWIMDNLDYRMIHDPEQMQQYIESQDGL